MTRISLSRAALLGAAELRQRDVERARTDSTASSAGCARRAGTRFASSQCTSGMSRGAGSPRPSREVDRVLRAAERRRVGQLGLLEVVDRAPHLDRHREGVDPLGDAVLREELRAEQAPVDFRNSTLIASSWRPGSSPRGSSGRGRSSRSRCRELPEQLLAGPGLADLASKILQIEVPCVPR